MLEGHANSLLDLRYVGGNTVRIRVLARASGLTPACNRDNHRDDRNATSDHSVHATLFPDMRLTTRAISCPRTTMPCSIKMRFNSDSTSDSDPLFEAVTGAGAGAAGGGGSVVALGAARRGGGPMKSASSSAPNRSRAAKPSCVRSWGA